MVGAGLIFGRASARPHVKHLATLRLKQDVGVDDGKGQESVVYTTRFGKYWHRMQECSYLEVSTQVLTRTQRPACVKRTLPERGTGVAETPPGDL